MTGRLFAALTAMLSAFASTAPATTLYWYPTSGTPGGAGSWDPTTANRWSTSQELKIPSASVPSVMDDVVFAGTAGTVTIGSGSGGHVTANIIYIETDGYVFSSGGATTTRSIMFAGFSGNGLASAIITGASSTGMRGITLTATADTTFSGRIVDYVTNPNLGLNINKTGSGSLTLTGTNTYTGTTAVSAGALIINGDQTAATGNVTVTNATLGGSGIIGGATTIGDGGVLAPGSTEGGTLTFKKDLTIAHTNSTVVFEGGDHMIVEGQLTLANDWNLTLSSGFTDGGSVVLFTFGSLNGAPDLTPDFDISGLGFTPSSPLTLSQVGNTIVLNGISVSVIPEPTTGLLVLLGIGAASLFRWRVRNV